MRLIEKREKEWDLQCPRRSIIGVLICAEGSISSFSIGVSNEFGTIYLQFKNGLLVDCRFFEVRDLISGIFSGGCSIELGNQSNSSLSSYGKFPTKISLITQ